jgi:undecaprenyl diphosphate synthase
MDGNGRWARKRGLPRVAGHRAGVETVRRMVRACAKTGIKALTLYAFSADNWKRPENETGFLMGLLARFLRREIAELDRNRVRLRTIGNTAGLPAFARRELARGMKRTAGNSGLVLTLALNYSSRQEILDGARKMARDLKAGKAPAHRDGFGKYLYTSFLPDPDLIIRTSGEMRLSDFLLWQGAYAELWFTRVLWPDFKEQHLAQALREFARRSRRYGGIAAQEATSV